MKLIVACLSLAFASQVLAKSKPQAHVPLVFTGTASESTNADFEGIVKLSGCSGSFVKFKGQSVKSRGMILTNDHCVDDQAYGTFTTHKPYSKSFQIYDKNKKFLPKSFVSTKIIYATQTNTDFALFEIPETYEQIEKLYNVTPLELMDYQAAVGDKISVITGLFGKVINCTVDGFVHQIVEDSWTWTNSYRYFDCETGHGTSGSPIVMRDTREVVGINNTGNDDGGKCTLNNPCEVSETGVVTAIKGHHYGQQIMELYTCLNSSLQFDVKTPGCKLLGGDNF